MEFRLVAYSQYWENYNTKDPETGPGYWKPKGGSEYLIATLSLEEVVELGQSGMSRMVRDASTEFERKNCYVEEYLLDWVVLAPGELTEDERLEREYGSSNPEWYVPKVGAWTRGHNH